MPNPRNAFHNNTPGPWYVDDQCICCGLCENVAPELFRMSADGSHYLVYRQPAAPQDLEDAENAMERCPATAIGSDRVIAPTHMGRSDVQIHGAVSEGTGPLCGYNLPSLLEGSIHHR